MQSPISPQKFQKCHMSLGHSFWSCDRDFVLIEKRKHVVKAIVPNDLRKLITSAKFDPPFEVFDTLNISRAIRIKVDRKNPTVLLTKEFFTDLEPWKEVTILKKRKTIKYLKSAATTLLPCQNKISGNEKASQLQQMIDKLTEHRRPIRLIGDPALICYLEPLTHWRAVLVTSHFSTGIQTDSAPPS
nr:unnamed protein product [Callosobruchus chinensis]